VTSGQADRPAAKAAAEFGRGITFGCQPDTEGFYRHMIKRNEAKAAGCIANVMLRRKEA